MKSPVAAELALYFALAVSPAMAASLPSIAPVPTPEQRAWQELGTTLFAHFGINTFTDREWGDGKEDPKLFNPAKLDARQWVRAAKAGGFKLMILTAKHHDGFCLWQSQYTEHSVKNAAWREGKGDVVREFTTACRAGGMKVGIYLSPWDRHEPSYGTEAYNRHFTNQLTELLTQYGKIDEVWFDGACGEGPNGKKQVYDWPAFYRTIRALAPQAVIAISGPDIRWVGNESGLARPGESSVQKADPAIHGHEMTIWWPAECDVSIRPGWFYHAAQDREVKPLAHLLDLYFKSVGRNSVLLVNVPPNRDGLFADPDVRRLEEFGNAVRAMFARDLAQGQRVKCLTQRSGRAYSPQRAVDGKADTFWAAPDGATNGVLTVSFETPQPINLVLLREPFWLGERAQSYRLEAEVQPGQWQPLAAGSVIGAENLVNFPEVTARAVRLSIDSSRASPAISQFSVYRRSLTP